MLQRFVARVTGKAATKTNAGGRIMSEIGRDQQYRWPDLAVVENQQQNYVESSQIYTAVGRIAKAVAVKRFDVLEVTVGDDGKEKKTPLPSHWIIKLLRQPNTWMSRYELLESTFSFMCLCGNAYWYADGNQPSEIIPLNPARMRIVAGPDTQTFVRGYVYRVNNIDIPLDAASVVHFKYFHPRDDFYGLSPMLPAALATQSDLAMSRWNRGYFADGNGVPPNMVSVEPTVTDTEFERLQEDFARNYRSNAKERRTLFLRGGSVTYNDLSKSQKDMDFLGGRKFNKEEIMLAFGIPPGILDANATEANALAGNEVFTSQTLWPLTVMFTEKLSAVWCDPAANEVIEPEDFRVKDATAELREMQAGAPYLTINEVRAKYFDLPPVMEAWGESMATGPGSGLPNAPVFGKPNVDTSQHQVQLEDQSIASPTKALTRRARDEIAQFSRYAAKGKPIDRFTFNHLAESTALAVKAIADIGELDLLVTYDGKTHKAILPASQRISITGIADPNSNEKADAAQALADAFSAAFNSLQADIVSGIKHVAANDAQSYLDYFDNRWWKAALAAIVAALYAVVYDIFEQAIGINADVTQIKNGGGYDPAQVAPEAADLAQSWVDTWLPTIMQTTRAGFEALLTRWGMGAEPQVRDLVGAVQDSPLFGDDRATMIGETENTRLWALAVLAGALIIADALGFDEADNAISATNVDDLMPAHTGCVCFSVDELVYDDNGKLMGVDQRWFTLKDGHLICPVCDARDGLLFSEIMEQGL